MTYSLSLPAAVSLLAGVFLLVLPPYIYRYRDRNPSAEAYSALLVASAAWALSYGVALTVFDPGHRAALEGVVWVARGSVVFFIILAGFRYTGHDDMVPEWMARTIVVMWLAFSAGAVTNGFGLHEMLWTWEGVGTVFGGATAEVTPTPLLTLLIVWSYLLVAVVLLLLIETVVSYGPLYRLHAVGIVLWAMPPVVASVAFSLNLSGVMEIPYADLDLAAPSLMLTFFAIGYMLFVRQEDLMEVAPANRRHAENAALDDMDAGVVIVNPGGLVLALNESARRELDIGKENVLGEPLDEVAGAEVPTDPGELQNISFPSDPSRVYCVASSPIEHGDTHLGHIVSIQDITEERRRQQRLEVQNRVLRHNLRNDMLVVGGNTESIRSIVESSDDIPEDVADDILEKADAISRKHDELVRVSERAREITETLPEDAADGKQLVDVGEVAASIADELMERHPEASIETVVDGDVEVCTDEALLSNVIYNAVENAVLHGSEAGDTVELTVAESENDGGDGVEVSVHDEGEGIPEHELEVVRRGSEDALNHGSGMGLWIIQWGMQSLGGEVEFDTEDGGTTVVLRALERR